MRSIKKGAEIFISRFNIEARNYSKWLNVECEEIIENKQDLWKGFRQHTESIR